jgi:diamine N-acetyltransferase
MTKRITRADKSGKPFEIGIAGIDDFPSLLEMYRVFSPKPASQGLPPEDPETCHHWVRKLFETGENFLAWRGGSVIGHAALVPDLPALVPDLHVKSAEFVIFVHQDQRSLGIGTELSRFTLKNSMRLGFKSVWLTVNVLNSIAIKLYKKVGFNYFDMDTYERTMKITLSV